MKKFIAAIAVMTVTCTYSQHKQSHQTEFTPEQQSQLKVKQLAIDLDLNQKQQEKLYVLYVEKAKEKAVLAKDKENFKSKVDSMSTDQKFNHAMEMLTKKEKFHQEMKTILTKEQYEAWTNIEKKQHHKHSKKHQNPQSTYPQ